MVVTLARCFIPTGLAGISLILSVSLTCVAHEIMCMLEILLANVAGYGPMSLLHM